MILQKHLALSAITGNDNSYSQVYRATLTRLLLVVVVGWARPQHRCNAALDSAPKQYNAIWSEDRHRSLQYSMIELLID